MNKLIQTLEDPRKSFRLFLIATPIVIAVVFALYHFNIFYVHDRF